MGNPALDIIPEEVPEAQWAQVIPCPKAAPELKQIPTPKVPSDGLLVKLEVSGVCASDVHAWQGDWPIPTKSDLVTGHEGVGIVAKIGDDVSDFAIGDRVGIQLINSACGSCTFCTSGDHMLCSRAQITGFTADGTFQQYCVCQARCAIRIPDGISTEAAAPVLCAGVTAYKALLEADLRPGDIVAIDGAAGGLGSMACQYAKVLGYRVLALASGDDKRRLCLDDLGVDFFIDHQSCPDVVGQVQALTDGGPRAVLLFSSAEAPFHQALQYVRPTGTIVIVGVPPGAVLQLSIFLTIVRRLTLKGSYIGTVAETQQALDLFVKHGLHIPYDVCQLQDVPAVFDKISQGHHVGRTIAILPK